MPNDPDDDFEKTASNKRRTIVKGGIKTEPKISKESEPTRPLKVEESRGGKKESEK